MIKDGSDLLASTMLFVSRGELLREKSYGRNGKRAGRRIGGALTWSIAITLNNL